MKFLDFLPSTKVSTWCCLVFGSMMLGFSLRLHPSAIVEDGPVQNVETGFSLQNVVTGLVGLMMVGFASFLYFEEDIRV